MTAVRFALPVVRFASSESSDAAFQRDLRTARLVDLGSLMPRKADRFIPRSRTRGRAVARLPGRQVARPQGTGDGALRRRLGEQGGDPLCCVYRGMPLPYIHMHSANSPDRPSYSDDSLLCHFASPIIHLTNRLLFAPSQRNMVNLFSTISGFLSESIDPARGQKSFYDLKTTLPGSKGELDFVRRSIIGDGDWY